jgi:hypothetical protein
MNSYFAHPQIQRETYGAAIQVYNLFLAEISIQDALPPRLVDLLQIEAVHRLTGFTGSLVL